MRCTCTDPLTSNTPPSVRPDLLRHQFALAPARTLALACACTSMYRFTERNTRPYLPAPTTVCAYTSTPTSSCTFMLQLHSNFTPLGPLLSAQVSACACTCPPTYTRIARLHQSPAPTCSGDSLRITLALPHTLVLTRTPATAFMLSCPPSAQVSACTHTYTACTNTCTNHLGPATCSGDSLRAAQSDMVTFWGFDSTGPPSACTSLAKPREPVEPSE